MSLWSSNSRVKQPRVEEVALLLWPDPDGTRVPFTPSLRPYSTQLILRSKELQAMSARTLAGGDQTLEPLKGGNKGGDRVPGMARVNGVKNRQRMSTIITRESWALVGASRRPFGHAAASGGFVLAFHRRRCCALILLSLWLTPSPVRATGYELEGKATLVYPNRPESNQDLAYLFRRDGPRWQLDVRGNSLYPYEVTSMACTGEEMILFFKNRVPSGRTAPTDASASQEPPATVAPFQAEVRPGVHFPKYSNLYFGQILAALAPDLLENNLQRNACQLVYSNTNALAQAAIPNCPANGDAWPLMSQSMTVGYHSGYRSNLERERVSHGV